MTGATDGIGKAYAQQVYQAGIASSYFYNQLCLTNFILFETIVVIVGGLGIQHCACKSISYETAASCRRDKYKISVSLFYDSIHLERINKLICLFLCLIR